MIQPRALVVSPTPTHPPDHGNRNRVHQMTRALADLGFAVDFVLYPIDDDWQGAVPPAFADMQLAWDSVTPVAPSRPLHAGPIGADHMIDEWWDDALERQVAWLVARRRYAVMLVNYAFLSRALTLAPPGCVRVLDTHDRLAGRRQLFERHGRRPEFFHTTEDQEKIALERADVVVAIKESEAITFRMVTDRPVIAVPFLPAEFHARFEIGDGPLRVGFIGANNQVNAANLGCFLGRLAAHRQLFLPDIEMVVAGNVGRSIAGAAGVTLLGHLDDVGAFYRAVDVVVAPLAFSTGLKVKVAEALAWNCPVVATGDAFDGFAATDPFHHLPDIDAVCMALMELAADWGRRALLAAATESAVALARQAVIGGLAAFARAIAAHRHCLVVVTDVPFWRRGCVLEERGLQAIAFLGQTAPVVVFIACALEPDAVPVGIEMRPIGPLSGPRLQQRVAREIARLAEHQSVLGCWQSLTEQCTPLVLAVPVIVDGWPYAAGHPQSAEEAAWRAHDLRFRDRRIAAIPLRHLPTRLPWDNAGIDETRPLLVLVTLAPDGLDPTRMRLASSFQRFGGRRRTAVLRTSDVASDPHLLGRLAALRAPVAIVTVEMPQLSREIVECLARGCNAAVFHLAVSLYPQIGPPVPCGATELVTDAWSHAATIVAWLAEALPTGASEMASDAGWSIVWRELQTAARMAREAAGGSYDAGPRCGRDAVHLLSTA